MGRDETHSRRGFLAAGVSTAAALAGWSGRVGAADEVDPRVARLVAETVGVDTHNHIDVPLTAAEVPGPDLDLAGEMRRSGLSAICATFAVDYQRLDEPGIAYDRFRNGMKSLDAQLARVSISRALNLRDLQAAHAQGKPTVIQAVEGGHFLEGKAERVAEAHAMGLRVLGLLHDNDASVPLGDIYTKPARLGGLTEFGARVVEECHRLGILVDLTHGSAETVAAALKVVRRPVLYSHTGLDSRLGTNPGMGQMMRPRLISKELARTIADAGGVIGVWTHLVNSPAEYVGAIRALVDAAGVDHVAIGTDTKLTPGNRPGGGGPGGPARGPGGPGGGGGGPGGGRGRMGGSTNQAWADQKVGFFHAVVAEMVRQGFSDGEVGKIGGGNFARIFEASTTEAPRTSGGPRSNGVWSRRRNEADETPGRGNG